MIKGECNCGAIQFEANTKPAESLFVIALSAGVTLAPTETQYISSQFSDHFGL